MWMDSRTTLSDAQALTATAVSTNVYNLEGDINVGRGNDLYFVAVLDVAADDGDADETYVMEIQTSVDEVFTSPVELATITIPAGSAAGTIFQLRLPNDNLQFLRVNYTLGGTTPTVTVTTFITGEAVQTWESYPDAQN